MSTKPNRKLPDARYTFSPPPLSQLADRLDKYGVRYGSTGDISTGARDFSRFFEKNRNRNNPVVPGKDGVQSNKENAADLSQTGHTEQQNATAGSESSEEQPLETTAAYTGIHLQPCDNVIASGSTNTKLEEEVPECFSLSQKFSKVKSPTEIKNKAKRKQSAGSEPASSQTPRRAKPTASHHQEEDFFENLFLSSLEFISDEATEMETLDSDQDSASFEELYQKNKKIWHVQNGSVSKSEKKQDKQHKKAVHLISQSQTPCDAKSATGGVDSRPGILQRHPISPKRHANVHFNSEVSVETYSYSDEDFNATKALLAHGDGPPNNIPGTSIPLPPPVPDLSSPSGSGINSLQALKQKFENLGMGSNKGPVDYVKGKILRKLGNSSNSPIGINRKDSLPNSVSPTELLRQKQKTVTDKIIKETSSQKWRVPAAIFRSDKLSSGSRNLKNIPPENAVNKVDDMVREKCHLREEKLSRGMENGQASASDIPSGNTKPFSVSADISEEKIDITKHKLVKPDELNSKTQKNGAKYIPIESAQTKQIIFNAKLGAYLECDKENIADSFKQENVDDRLGYTTPFKPFQKADLNKGEKNNQVLGGYRFATSSELLMKRESPMKSSSKEQPGFWTIKRDLDSGIYDVSTSGEAANIAVRDVSNTNISGNISMHAKNESDTENASCKEDNWEAEARRISKRKKKFMDRCKRKHRLDSLAQQSQENLSCVDAFKNILDRTTSLESDTSITSKTQNISETNIKSVTESYETVAGSSEMDAESDSSPKNQNITETNVKSVAHSIERLASTTEMANPISMMQELLSDFLNMMDRKISQGSGITVDIIRELEFVYDSLVYFAKSLVDQQDEEAVDSSGAPDMLEAEMSKNYAVWMSMMLESTASFLKNTKFTGNMQINSRVLPKNSEQKTQSRHLSDVTVLNGLQTVLCDLGVVRDSLTCLLMDDQTDFNSITDLKTLSSQIHKRQHHVYNDTSKPVKDTGDLSSKKYDEGAENSGLYKQADPDVVFRVEAQQPTQRNEGVKEEFEKQKLVEKTEQKDQISPELMETIIQKRKPDSVAMSFKSVPVETVPSFKSDRKHFKSISENQGTISDTRGPFIVTYVYLCDFIHMIEKNQECGISMTLADCRELELIYDTLLMIADSLIAETEDTLSTTANMEVIQQTVDMGASISETLQAQHYACWLIDKLGSTANLLLKQSSTDIQPSGQGTGPVGSSNEYSDTDSKVSLQDTLTDLKTIHNSMTNLLYGNQWDFADPNSYDTQTEQTVRGKEVPNDSGYLADTDSQESLTGLKYHRQPRNSIFLKGYQNLKKNQRTLEHLAIGHVLPPIDEPGSFSPEGRHMHPSILNKHNIQMPQREWSPRDHRHFSSTDPSSRDDNSDKITECSQDRTSSKSLSSEYYYSPSGHLLFDDVNFPSSSISLNDELSLSTWGSLQDSDWGLLEEQKAADELNGRRIYQKGMSVLPAETPRYYPDKYGVQNIDKESVSSQFRPGAYNVLPEAPRFVSPEKLDAYLEEEGVDNFRDNIGNKALEESKPDGGSVDITSDDLGVSYETMKGQVRDKLLSASSYVDKGTRLYDHVFRETVSRRERLNSMQAKPITDISSDDQQFSKQEELFKFREGSSSQQTMHQHPDKQKLKHGAYYELYEKGPIISKNFPDTEGTGPEQEEPTRRKSSVTLTSNPIYTDRDGSLKDAGTGGEVSGQLSESPGSYSILLRDPATKSDLSSFEQKFEKEIKWSTFFKFPEDAGSVFVDLGPSKFTLNRIGKQASSVEQKAESREMVEGDSPERGQRLYGSIQNLDRRGEAAVNKRKPAHPTGRSMTPDTRSFMMEREVTESQNRKLQMEISTLQTENKLLKEKYNRATAKISELETQLQDTQEDLNSLQETLNKEMSDLSARTRSEIDRDRDRMEKRIVAFSKENEMLKAEVTSLEKQLGSSHRETDMARQSTEKNKMIEAHKSEMASLKEELRTVKALLEQSEHHLRAEEERHSEVSKQLLQLTELKNALQQQADSGGSGMVTDKQLKSLEKRLKVTEERLYQERADRANNLSTVEDKLLTENARLQAMEKEFTRQLHREKDRNRNLEQRLKQVREENEKLRLALPFDDSVLQSNKDSYDIPYSSHSNQRGETLKITDDMNYILSQIEKQDGIQSGQKEEMIRVLWNKRELAYKQLREWELQLKELRIDDNNIVDGLKNLRDTYGQAESKLKQMEEQVEDTKAKMNTLESTYKEQLSQLVKERHEAFARLKTAEDLLESVRAENNILRQSVPGHQIAADSRHVSDSSSSEALQVEVTSLQSKVTQLMRQNKLLEGELSTVRVQLDARTKTLEEVQAELENAYREMSGGEKGKKQKIEILSAQLNSLQVELNNSKEKYSSLLAEKINLDVEFSNLKKSSEHQKTRQPRTETIESKALQKLKDSLAEKEGRVTSLSLQLEEAENQLQKTRQDLYIEQEHTSELEAEVETLQQTVTQRAQMFESLSGTEREQYTQYQLLKETLDSVTQELSHKHAQIISLDVNLSGQKDRVAELEQEIQELKQQHSESGEPEREEVRAGDRLRVHELELERASLKQELSKAYSAIQASEQQFRTIQTENKQLEQEAVKEKTVVLQITAEKGEIEQHLEELAEEHDALIQEKNQAEEDLIKLENKLQEILQKYETQARKQHGNFETQYSNLTPEAKQMASELDSLRLLLDGKEKEMGMLHDKINRQLIEIDFLNRKVDLVHNDSIANREDVARMISELTLKMKEAVSVREVNQFLVGERTKLQTEKIHIEKELEQERKNNDKRKTEINEVIKKVETSELQQMSIKKQDKNNLAVIATLEADLRNAKQNLTTTQTENTQLKNRLDHLQEDLKNLTAINATMEKRLEMEQNSLSEEKNTAFKWKEDYNTTVHDLELLRHEHLVLGNKLEAEKHAVENLKKEVQTKDELLAALEEELRNMKLELDSNKGQLLLTKDTVEKLTQDKGSIYQDYEGLCRSLTDKERQLNEVRDRSEEKMEYMKKEHTAEKLRLEQDKTTAEKERDIIKEEMDKLNEELKHKEIQLSTFGKTLSDLETVTRKKNELEGHLRRLEGAAGDSKLLLEGQRKEVMSLNEALAKQQDEVTRLQVTNKTLQMDLKSERDTSSREIHDLKLMLEELKSQHENEKHYLNDSLTQTQKQFRSVQESFAQAAEARDGLQAQKRLADHTIEELQSKLSDESTARRLLEQSLGTLRLELEDVRNEKTMSEARLAETKNQLAKSERHLKSEQEKSSKLSGRVQELSAMTQSSDANVKAKDEQVDLLHKEITKLRQMLDSQKQNLTAKMKTATLEFNQKLDLVLEDKDKLSGQIQKLSNDLDLCREQIANKNKENLKLQEKIVTLEDSVREGQVKLKQAQDSLKMESENQSQLSSSEIGINCDDLIDEQRYQEQDEELKRLRSFLAKKVEESGEADKSMWHEMNRVIHELSRQMQSHLDAKSSENKTADTQTIQRYKKQLAEVQGELSTERSLHQITKTSLQALDEDCNRLKQQLHKLRRREKSPSVDRKYKNRMEAINAIIARSQSQAQALLASGGYIDDINYNNPRRAPLSPHREYHSTNRPESPDDSYASDLSIASLPPMPFSQYTTTTKATEAK